MVYLRAWVSLRTRYNQRIYAATMVDCSRSSIQFSSRCSYISFKFTTLSENQTSRQTTMIFQEFGKDHFLVSPNEQGKELRALEASGDMLFFNWHTAEVS